MVSIFLCAILIFVSLIGCVTPTQESVTTGEETFTTNQDNKPVTINLFTTEAATPEAEKYMMRFIDDFTEKTGIKVELTKAGNVNEIEAKLNASMLSNTYPDLLYVTLFSYSSRVARGEYADISDYINNWSEKDDFFDAAIEIGKYKGKSLGIGSFPVPEIIAYRKDFFKEEGLDPENPPKNWDELYEAAKKLVKYNNNGEVTRGGFDVPISDPNLTLMEAFLRQNGNGVIDEDNEIMLFDEPSAVEAMEYLRKFVEEKLTVPYQRGKETPVLVGKSAMGIVYVNEAISAMEDDPNLKQNLGFIPVLENKQKFGFTGYRLFMIGQSSKYKDEAFEFIKEFLSKEEMWERYKLFGNAPTRKSLEQDFISQDTKMNKAIIETIKHGKGRPIVPWVPIFSKHLVLAYEEIMNGVKSAEQALSEAKAKTLEELGKMDY